MPDSIQDSIQTQTADSQVPKINNSEMLNPKRRLFTVVQKFIMMAINTYSRINQTQRHSTTWTTWCKATQIILLTKSSVAYTRAVHMYYTRNKYTQVCLSSN